MSSDVIKIKVLFFGPARDAAGADTLELVLPGGSRLGDVAAKLSARFAALASGMSHVRFAVNEEYAGPDRVLQQGDEIAVIPPVSGGNSADWIELLSEPIDAAAVRGHVAGVAELGGICIFEGVTRGERHPTHGELERLEYEAYGGMAFRQLKALASEARRRWPVGRLAMVHRTGPVQIAEPSVIIAVACPHRAEAFEACRWLIDALKKDVPIWKREVWATGAGTWADPTSEGPVEGLQ